MNSNRLAGLQAQKLAVAGRAGWLPRWWLEYQPVAGREIRTLRAQEVERFPHQHHQQEQRQRGD